MKYDFLHLPFTQWSASACAHSGAEQETISEGFRNVLWNTCLQLDAFVDIFDWINLMKRMKLHWILGDLDQFFNSKQFRTQRRGLYFSYEQEAIHLNVAASLSNVW